MILTLRTDKPEAEIGLYDDQKRIAYEQWYAHRMLAETLHQKLDEVLAGQKKQLSDIQGIVFYKGPGSFTGLRIGASVAGALAYSFSVPIVGITGENWQANGVTRIQDGHNDKVVDLEYGAPVRITQQKK